jgi:hypothetical protein
MLRKLTLSAILTASVLFLMPSSIAQSSPSALVGAWEFTLTPANNEIPPQPIIPGLITFNSEGNAIASVGAVEQGEPLPEHSTTAVSVAQGIWQPGPAAGRFFVKLISFSTTPAGTFQAKRTFTMSIALNATHDEFTGGYGYDVEDATGRVLTTGTGTIEGHLIVHPLLP